MFKDILEKIESKYPQSYNYFIIISIVIWMIGIYLFWFVLCYIWGLVFGFSSGEDTSPEPCYNNAPPYC